MTGVRKVCGFQQRREIVDECGGTVHCRLLQVVGEGKGDRIITRVGLAKETRRKSEGTAAIGGLQCCDSAVATAVSSKVT